MLANGLRRDPPIDKGLLDHSEKGQMDHSEKGQMDHSEKGQVYRSGKGGLTVCAFLKIFARA